MKTNKLFISSAVALIAFGVFIVLSLTTTIFKDADLPVQIMGALLGAIVTAFITMILLHGQSEAEQLKEKNVKVFEIRVQKYENFINELWKIWEDRKVSLEEVNELLELISKDIILYTKKDTVDKIFKCFEKIAVVANKEKKDENDKNSLQENVFEIINLLAKEINLGGEISKDTTKTIKGLEEQIRPVLEFKKNLEEVKKKYIAKFKDNIENKIDYSDIFWGDTTGLDWVFSDYGAIEPAFFIKLNKSEVSIIISHHIGIVYHVGSQYSKYNKYRRATRGREFEFIGCFSGHQLLLDINSKTEVEESKKLFDKGEDPTKEIADKIVEYYKRDDFHKYIAKTGEPKNDYNKTISQIIEECETR